MDRKFCRQESVRKKYAKPLHTKNTPCKMHKSCLFLSFHKKLCKNLCSRSELIV